MYFMYINVSTFLHILHGNLYKFIIFLCICNMDVNKIRYKILRGFHPW